jgi:hypothetical protein
MRIKIYKNKYLKNIFEQDHNASKHIARPMWASRISSARTSFFGRHQAMHMTRERKTQAKEATGRKPSVNSSAFLLSDNIGILIISTNLTPPSLPIQNLNPNCTAHINFPS